MGKRKSYKKKWGGDDAAVAAATNEVSVTGLVSKWQGNASAKFEEAKGQGLAKLAEHKAALTGELGALKGQVAKAKDGLLSKIPGRAPAAPMPAPAAPPAPLNACNVSSAAAAATPTSPNVFKVSVLIGLPNNDAV